MGGASVAELFLGGPTGVSTTPAEMLAPPAATDARRANGRSATPTSMATAIRTQSSRASTACCSTRATGRRWSRTRRCRSRRLRGPGRRLQRRRLRRFCLRRCLSWRPRRTDDTVRDPCRADLLPGGWRRERRRLQRRAGQRLVHRRRARSRTCLLRRRRPLPPNACPASCPCSCPGISTTAARCSRSGAKGIGDVNGDGFADFVYFSPGAGAVYLFFGSAAGPPSNPSQTITAEQGFGFSVAGM